MEEALVIYLNSDKKLTELIGKDSIYPGFTTDITKPSISYRMKILSEGPIKENQVTLNIICNDYDLCLEIEKQIVNLMHFDINKPNKVIENISFRGVLAGGGPLFDDSIQMWEDNIIFIIKWRYL
ncbi:hypothetical protein ACSXAB_13915 [Clostridium perfringens]